MTSLSTLASQKIVVWQENYNDPFILQSLQNIASLASSELGDYEFVASKKMNASEAFEALEAGNIDLFVGGINSEREVVATPVYVPLDRGLLGYRICLTNKNKPLNVSFKTPMHVIQESIHIGILENLIDTNVYQENGFKVSSGNSYSSLVNMLKSQVFDCFSRSINEINLEALSLQMHKKGSELIEIDNKMIFIYPSANFIFTSSSNKKLHQGLSIGIGRAIENDSYYSIFNEHYANILLKHGIYERKLIFMSNYDMSYQALSAINRFGIASFHHPATSIQTEKYLDKTELRLSGNRNVTP